MNTDFQKIYSLLFESPRKKILVVGDFFLDVYDFGTVRRTSSGTGIPIVSTDRTEFLLGGAGNIASNLASFSKQVYCIGNIAPDYFGNKMFAMMKEQGIQYINRNSKNKRTGTRRRIYIESEQVLRLDYDCKELLDTKKIKAFLKKASVDLIVVADYAGGAINQNVLDQIVSCKKCPVFFTSRKLSSFSLSKLDCVISSENDICQNKKMDVKHLLMTLGENGIMFRNSANSVYSPAIKTTAVNVSGAGDSVCAFFSAYYQSNVNLKLLLDLCNIVGSVAVENSLTHKVTLESVLVKFFKEKSFDNCKNKIVNLEFAKEVISSLKKMGQKIVFTNGCFDLLHAGHIQSLQYAKKQGDFLVVGVNSDESIKKIKGNTRPFYELDARLDVLSSLECVNMLIPMEDETAVRLLREIEPDIYVKGMEYKEKKIPELAVCKNYLFAPMKKNFSTTKTAQKIQGKTND